MVLVPIDDLRHSLGPMPGVITCSDRLSMMVIGAASGLTEMVLGVDCQVTLELRHLSLGYIHRGCKVECKTSRSLAYSPDSTCDTPYRPFAELGKRCRGRCPLVRGGHMRFFKPFGSVLWRYLSVHACVVGYDPF